MGCMSCDGETSHDLYEKAEYPIRRCAACGLTQLNPLPEFDRTESPYGGCRFDESSEGIGYADYAPQEAEYPATFREVLAAKPAPGASMVLD